MHSRILFFSAVSLGSGCEAEPDVTDLVTREEMDAAIQAAVTSALEEADCLPRDEASGYLSKAEAAGYLTKAEASATYATRDDVGAVEERVGFLEDDYAPAGDVLALTERVDAIQVDYALGSALAVEVADRAIDEATITGIFANYALTSTLVDYLPIDDLAESVIALEAAGELDPMFESSAANGALATTLGGYPTTSVAQSMADGGRDEAKAYADDLFGDVTAEITELDGEVVHILRDDTGTGTVTWNINAAGTGDFATVEDAIAALDDYHIPGDVLLEIKLAAGDYEFDAPLAFVHPDGARLRLVGDEAAPDTVTMSFPSSSGIIVGGSSALGYLAGVEIDGIGASNTYGILVQDSSSLVLGPVILSDWYYGLEAWTGSFVRGDYASSTTAGWLSVRDSTYHGMLAAAGSGFWLPNTESIDSGGDGVHLAWGSVAYMPGASAEGNSDVGFSAHGGSYLDVVGATAEDNATGFKVWLGSAAEANNARAVNNTDTGFSTALASYTYAESPVVSGSEQAFHTAGVAGMSLFSPSASGSNTGYRTYGNSFMYVDGAVGDISTATSQNDTTDFIFGL